MKKALVVLLTLAVAGVLVAQAAPAPAPALRLSGSLQTGVTYDIGDNVIDPVIWNRPDDANVCAVRLRLQGDFADGDTGLRFRLSSRGGPVANAPALGVALPAIPFSVNLDLAWAWTDLFDKMVRVTAGYNMDLNSWRTRGAGEFDYEASGVQVEVKPVEGLNLGGALYLPNAAGSAVKIDDARYVAGFAYAVDVFGVQGGLDYNTGDLQSVYAGVNFTGIENLALAAEVQANNLPTYDTNGRVILVQRAAYTLDALNVGVQARQFVYGNAGTDFGLRIAPWVAYTMGMNTFRVDVAYRDDEIDIGSAAARNPGGVANDVTITVEPSIVTRFNTRARLETGFIYVAMTDMEFNNSQRIYVNFIYSF